VSSASPFRIRPYAREYTEGEITALEERIMLARTFLAVYLPFFGYLLAKIKIRIAQDHHRVATAAVTPDGIIYLNYEFALQLSDQEIRFLLVHEMLHPALLYFTRLKMRRNDLFNMAHDYVINNMISEYAASDSIKNKNNTIAANVKFIKGGLLNDSYKNMTAEDIYDDLIRVQLKNDKGGNGMPGPGGKGKMSKQAKAPGSSSPSVPNLQDGPGEKGEGEGEGEEQESDCRPDLADSDEAKRAAHGDDGAIRDLERYWALEIEAARQHHRNTTRGDLPGGMSMILKELYDHKVTWAEYVSNYIGENMRFPDSSYRRIGRRSEEVGEIMPGVVFTGVPDVTVLWDTSGSMYGLEATILSEVAGICEELSLTIRIIMCDAKVQAVYESFDDADKDSFAKEGKIKGGGGSDFSPAFKLMEDEANDNLVIVFTDGYIGAPAVPPPLLKGVLWVIIPNTGPRPAEWGDAIFVTDKGIVVEPDKK